MVNSDDPFNPSYLSPGHFLIGQPITQIPSVDYTNVKSNSLSDGKPTNRCSRRSGKDGRPTTSRNFSSDDDGIKPTPTFSQANLYYCERTTHHHYNGPQLSSVLSSQEGMETFV
jgi:hypothetical protein